MSYQVHQVLPIDTTPVKVVISYACGHYATRTVARDALPNLAWQMGAYLDMGLCPTCKNRTITKAHVAHHERDCPDDPSINAAWPDPDDVGLALLWGD